MIKVHLSDGSFQTYEEDVYYTELRKIRNEREPNKMLHEILIKGDIPKIFFDGVLMKKFCSITYNYGRLLFIGNWDEYDNFCNFLVENEGKQGFKLI